MKKDLDIKLDLVTEKNVKQTIPFIVYENSEVRHERREQRLICIIILLIVLLVGSNFAWLIYDKSFEDVTTTTETTIEQKTENGDNANFMNGGDVINGIPKSNSQDNN